MFKRIFIEWFMSYRVNREKNLATTLTTILLSLSRAVTIIAPLPRPLTGHEIVLVFTRDSRNCYSAS